LLRILLLVASGKRFALEAEEGFQALHQEAVRPFFSKFLEPASHQGSTITSCARATYPSGAGGRRDSGQASGDSAKQILQMNLPRRFGATKA
jgi:hypothetical protein